MAMLELPYQIEAERGMIPVFPDAIDGARGSLLPAGIFLPSGHLSLLDMINFQIVFFVRYLDLLDYERGLAKGALSSRASEIIDPAQKERVLNNISAVATYCARIGLANVEQRFGHFLRVINKPLSTYRDLGHQVDVLRETLLDSVQFENFYHYPKGKSAAYLHRGKEWEATLGKFLSAKEDIDAATDCYALGHNTACVFHLMRIGELGLRTLARSLKVEFPKTGKPVEWAEWNELIEQIQKKGREQANAQPPGPKRDAAKDFYNGAVGQFEGFKDKYRNQVMHLRARYDELEALSAMNHVRDFMNSLSRKLNEKAKMPIKKWP
jgi:hypothetical protein